MGQTNIQVPIEQREHDVEVHRKREVLLGDKRFKDPGPSSLGMDDKVHPTVLCHNSVSGPELQLATEASDLLYGERMGTRKQFMSGRRHAGSHLNAGLNVGSEHLEMEPEPHGPLHKKEGPSELGKVLPKDQ